MAITTPTTMDRFGTALSEMLAAQAAFSGVIITDGIPSGGQFDSKEWVEIGDIDFAIDVKSMNATTQPREERYAQEVLISVVKSTRSGQRAANARAWELYSALHTAIRENVSLSGYFTGDGQIIAAVMGTGRLSKRVDEANSLREAAIEFGINVHARI